MADQFEQMLAECVAVREEAAGPLTISAQATQEANDRSLAQFRQNLPNVPGGIAAARDSLLRASKLLGALSKSIALFHNPGATEISADAMASARIVVERECRFRVAKAKGKDPADVDVSDGMIC